EAMVIRTGEEKDPHWNNQAANVLTALLSFICSEIKPEERNLSSLRELVAHEELRNTAVAMMQAKGGVFARAPGVIAELQDKEKAGVLSTVHQHTTFLDSVAVLPCVSKSTFTPRDLLRGNMTIYLILPPYQLEAQARWLRLVVASFIRLIGREGHQENG